MADSVSALGQADSKPTHGSRSAGLPRRPQGRFGFRILILDRYVFREFVFSFVAVMAFCSLLMLVASVFERFQDIITNNTPLGKAAEYFIYSLPFRVMQVVPMASMLAVLFSVGGLARNNEILAFMTNGVHAFRIATPVIFGGLLIFCGSLFMNEKVVPPLEAKARYIQLRYLEAKDESRIVTERDIFERGRNNRFYLMPLYDSKEKKMFSPQIADLTADKSSLTQRIDADSARLVADDAEQDRSEWLMKNTRIWQFNEKGEVETFKEYPGETKIYLEPSLGSILAQRKRPEEMNFAELHQYIRTLHERQQPAHSYTTDLIFKVSFPMGILIILVIGYSYAVRARSGAAMGAFGYGVFWAFLYYGCSALFRALGHSGTISPEIAALLPVVLFFFVALHYLRRSYRWYT